MPNPRNTSDDALQRTKCRALKYTYNGGYITVELKASINLYASYRKSNI